MNLIEVVLQLLGTLSFFGLTVIFWRVYSDPEKFKICGRNLLMWASLNLGLIGLIRSSVLLGLTGQIEARMLNGLITIFILILVVLDRARLRKDHYGK